MDFEIFNNKKTVNGKIDLLSNYAKFNYEEIAIKDWLLIDEGSNTSIDLVALVAYGRHDYLDLLVKFNRLNANPLYIPTGTIIMIPELSSMLNNLTYVDLSLSSSNILQSQTKAFNKLKVSLTSKSPGSKTTLASNYLKMSSGAYVF